jgi:hypothetical protein
VLGYAQGAVHYPVAEFYFIFICTHQVSQEKKEKNNMGHLKKLETLKLALGVDVRRECSIFLNAPQIFMLHNMTCKYTSIFCPMLA